MTNDDFNFMRDDSDLPLSIEELAAYLDGNLSDAEMQHVASVIESSDPMQSIMDGLEQAEDTFAGYGAEDVQLPEELTDDSFSIPGAGFFAFYHQRFGRMPRIVAFAQLGESDGKSNGYKENPPVVLGGEDIRDENREAESAELKDEK